MLKIVQADITTVTHGVIAHGVNCQQTMGSGVAKAIYTKWPEIRDSYMRYPKGPQLLGTVDFVDVTFSEPYETSIIVANCWTQELFGNGALTGVQYADPAAILKALLNVYHYADAFDLPVAIPKIGCGLAGLNWENDVLPIVEHCIKTVPRVDSTLYVI